MYTLHYIYNPIQSNISLSQSLNDVHIVIKWLSAENTSSSILAIRV